LFAFAFAWLINQNARTALGPTPQHARRAKRRMDAAAAVRLERKLRPLSAHYGANEGDFGSMALAWGCAQWRALRKRFFIAHHLGGRAAKKALIVMNGVIQIYVRALRTFLACNFGAS
jgi:hypothetical protein